MKGELFVDTPHRSPRCACGSSDIVSSDHLWSLVRLNEDGTQILDSVQLKVAACRDCGAILFFVPWLELPQP
jgi:hypothetical protein